MRRWSSEAPLSGCLPLSQSHCQTANSLFVTKNTRPSLCLPFALEEAEEVGRMQIALHLQNGRNDSVEGEAARKVRNEPGSAGQRKRGGGGWGHR